MVGTIVYQLTRSMTPEQIKQSGYDTYFVDHTAGVFPQFASGTPWTAATIGVTGDVIADLSEDMSAEQKARKTYDNILRLCDDPDVTDVIRFLREREVVHYQRFGEALRLATEKMDQKNVYMTNPAFDRTRFRRVSERGAGPGIFAGPCRIARKKQQTPEGVCCRLIRSNYLITVQRSVTGCLMFWKKSPLRSFRVLKLTSSV